MSLVLLVASVLVLVYSSWSQELIRQYVNSVMADGPMKVELGGFKLSFPLDLEATDVKLTMEGEVIQAGALSTSVAVAPLLEGRAELKETMLRDASIIIGAPDSAMYMTIKADTLSLDDAKVTLETMDINVERGRIAHGAVNMLMNPIPTPVDTTTVEPTEMKIALKRIDLDDFSFDMRMLPTIDSLGVSLPRAVLSDGLIDMKQQVISIGSFLGKGLNAAYIVPDSATIAATPVIPPSTSTSPPWTIKIDSIGFDQSQALYTTRGVEPLPGLDFTYISVDSVALGIKNFYNRETLVTVPLNISGIERCGVNLTATGTLAVDSVATCLRDFRVTTVNNTDLAFDGILGMGDMTTDPSTVLGLDLEGYLSTADAALMFPAAGPMLATLPRTSLVYALADIKGTAGDLAVRDLAVAINGCVKLRGRGRLQNVFDPARLGGNLALSGAFINLNPLKNALLSKETAKEFNIPLTNLTGNVDMHAGRIRGKLQAVTGKGRIDLNADWNGNAEAYDVNLATNDFPVNAFMPLLGVGAITADIHANGRGLDPTSPKMDLDATLDVKRAVYMNYDYAAVSGTVAVHDGEATLQLKGDNPSARFDLEAGGNLAGDTYVWNAKLNNVYADLTTLGLMPGQVRVNANLNGAVSYTPTTNTIDGRLTVRDLNYRDSVGSFDINNVLAHLNSNDSVTNVSLHNRDFYAFLSSDNPLDSLLARMGTIGTVIDEEIAAHTVDVERLQRALPPFVLDINAGSNNAITDILNEDRMGFKRLAVNASNDSTLTFDLNMLGFYTPTMRLDTINMSLAQYGPRMIFTGHVDNRPGSFDEWAHVKLDGYLADNRLGLTLSQHNIKGRQGYNVGLAAELNDSSVVLRIDPTDPTIAYQPWTVNEDNFLEWSFAHKHLDANLHMSGAGSSLAIYTQHPEGEHDFNEELIVQISDIQIADWVNINPFAPPMAGLLNANIAVSGEDNDINGKGTVSITDLMYNRERVGTIGADLSVNTTPAGRVRANVDLSVDGVKTITIAGALNDSTAGSPLALDFSMIHFPLTTVNPFLPADMASLRGTLNGQMVISGTASAPGLDGWLQFDSTAVKLNMTGTTYPVSNVKIPVKENIVTFDSFSISGTNGNPLALDGTVDIREISSPQIDLKLTANDFELCNTKKAARGADIYGKGLIGLNASVQGNMSFMRINATLDVLPGTNITYVMSDAEAAIQNHSTGELVKFVNFTDTAAVLAADSLNQSAMALMMQASLVLHNGSTINVDLSTDSRNRVSLQPEGTVNMTMMPFSDPRLTGRINIDNGFVRYTPPFMSEKYFTFENGSYISFSGDMMNPTLNIHAVDVLKANVTQTGQNSRLVNFDVSLAVTGTLNTMNVAFDLSTDDDVTVANELRTMSPEQRANQAMNMLLYNVYTGPGTTANSNLSGNMIYSFLTSQLNSWAARTIKGVDLSFGVDQYDRTYNGSTSTTTSYSYQVSKSLFNDRFKIVVGGNYSTDANADESFSQNLIKDISFEYFLNNARTMYLRLFRHTGYESILEGEITRTGVGFVYRRKLSTLRNLFRGEKSEFQGATTTQAAEK